MQIHTLYSIRGARGAYIEPDQVELHRRDELTSVIHTHTHTHNLLRPAAKPKGQAKADLLIHFSRYALVSLKPIQCTSPLRGAVPLAYYVFAESRVSNLTVAVWLEGDSSSVQHPILGS